MSRLVMPSSGQYTLDKWLNVNGQPFTLTVWLSLAGSKKLPSGVIVLLIAFFFEGSVFAGSGASSTAATVAAVSAGTSSITSFGSLSRRIPLKDACLTLPSLVISAILISQT